MIELIGDILSIYHQIENHRDVFWKEKPSSFYCVAHKVMK